MLLLLCPCALGLTSPLSSTSPLRLLSGREGCSHFTDEQTEVQRALGPISAKARLTPAHHMVSSPCPVPLPLCHRGPLIPRESLSTCCEPGYTWALEILPSWERHWVNRYTRKDTERMNPGTWGAALEPQPALEVRESFLDRTQLPLWDEEEAAEPGGEVMEEYFRHPWQAGTLRPGLSLREVARVTMSSACS